MFGFFFRFLTLDFKFCCFHLFYKGVFLKIFFTFFEQKVDILNLKNSPD